MLKRKKDQPTKTATAESAVKATVRSLGNGTLEFADNTVKFHLEKGRLKKQKETAIKIPITDIETVKQDGNKIIITWNGITDTFTAEKIKPLTTISEKITTALNEQRKVQEEAAQQKENEIPKMLSLATKIADSLFDILRSLQGRVDWVKVENYLKRSEENASAFAGLKLNGLYLDFKNLSLAAKRHLPMEVSNETYNILKSLNEYFNESASKNEIPEQTHPNCNDAKNTMMAYYTLNDIILGITVDDEQIGKETNELEKLMAKLSTEANLKMDIDAIKNWANKLRLEKGKESVIEESRAAFVLQLKELIAA
jgi:hypothetical protein